MAYYDKRSPRASPFTMFGVEADSDAAVYGAMLGADDLLKMLGEKGVSKADIARTIGKPSSRVSEIYSGKRKLQLDEAKKLVEKYQIEERLNPLSVPIARLLVLYAADSLDFQLAPDDCRVEEIARDFRAFSQFAADPRVRESQEAVEAFFQGLRLSPARTTSASA